jgi:excisionase family DNA binding protein
MEPRDASTPFVLQQMRCLRPAAVADHLDISISSVRRLIHAGQLDTIRIGSSIRVTESSVEKLLKTGTRRARRRDKQ